MTWTAETVKRLEDWAECWTDFSLSADIAHALARIGELEKGLREIVNETVFNQQRFAEDDDTDYFLRCFKAVKDRARTLLDPHDGE